MRIKLKYLDSDNQKRRDTAKFYYDNLSLLPIEFPKISLNVESVFHLFVINVENQKKLIDYLKKEGVMAGIHYPLPVHLHPAYKDRVAISKDMSVTEGIVKKIVSLPIYPELSHSDTKLIVKAMKKFFN